MCNCQPSALLRRIQLLTIVMVNLLAFTSAHADPITVNGSVTLTNNPPPSRPATVSLAGQNFSANAILVNGGFGLSACGLTGGPCTGASLSWEGGGSDLQGSFTLDGVTFPTNINNQLHLSFSSVTFAIPPEFFSAPAIRITAPFTFLGILSTPLFPERTFLTGEGTVDVFLVNQTIGGITGFFLDHAAYNFGPRAPALTIEPVPEPMTIVLFISGLAGMAVRLRSGNNRLKSNNRS